MTFRLEDSNQNIVSQNVVGYYTLYLPPGLSLVAYQFYHSDYRLGFLWPNAPDGAQFFKYTDGLGYEVSTFDAMAGAWSNPDLELTPGDAYYFNNPTAELMTHVFVGEVPEGILVNSIPAGLSAKASIVPQSLSLNEFGVPGEAGDQIHFYVNDGLGGGGFVTTQYVPSLGGWLPDLVPRIGEGFWIEKLTAQDWVREFSAR